MTYEEFKKAWVWALRESALPVLGAEHVQETLDLRTMDRVVKSFVEPPGGRRMEPFHVSAALAYRWNAIHTARTATTEEDMLHELLGLDRNRKPRTEKPWLRVDVTLRASTMWDKEIALPPSNTWKRWVRETVDRLENSERVVPLETVREVPHGLPEVLAWQGAPELQVVCNPSGELKLRGIEVPTWQAIQLPRKWDDSSRRQDPAPDDQLAAMFKRLQVAMNAWTEVLGHLTPRSA